MNNLGKTIGARIVTDQYLDKNVLKKMLAKKCGAMFPDDSPEKKQKVIILVEDSNDRLADEVVVEKTITNRSPGATARFDKPFISTAREKDNFSDIESPKSPKKGSYSHMVQERSRLIAK